VVWALVFWTGLNVDHCAEVVLVVHFYFVCFVVFNLSLVYVLSLAVFYTAKGQLSVCRPI